MSFFNSRFSGGVRLVALLVQLMPASALAQTKCSNYQEVQKQIEYPPTALRHHVYGAEVRVVGEISADQHFAVSFLEATDPAFFEGVLAAVGRMRCAATQQDPITWLLDFKADLGPDELPENVLDRRIARPEASQRRIVMLLPQGIDPSNDHDGLNELSRRLNSALGSRIAEVLQRRGIDVIAVLDPRPIGIQEKLETHAGSLRARHLMVITVETVPVDDEQQLRYRIQYSDDDLIFKSERLEAVLPSGTVARTYKIKGTKSGAANVLVETIAEDFLKGLDDDGRLKGLPLSQ